MKAQDSHMKKLVILVVGLLLIQMLIGFTVADAAPVAQCPSPGCGSGGYGYNPYPGYFPYGGLYTGHASQVYYKYEYCSAVVYQPYVPAFYWWEYPYYPSCGTCWDRWPVRR